MSDGYANFAVGSVQVAPSPANSGTTLTLQSGDGAVMPAVPFNAIVKPKNASARFNNSEIVRVTDITGDVLTIERAAEGTETRDIRTGWDFYAGVTAKTLDDLYAALSGAADRHYEQAFTNQSSITVTHSLGKLPAVTVIDSAGDEVFGDVEHTGPNQLTISFGSAFSGKVICN